MNSNNWIGYFNKQLNKFKTTKHNFISQLIKMGLVKKKTIFFSKEKQQKLFKATLY